ncbi:MAG: hypothetical protein ABGY96_12330 [bacterium]|nr:hypothetical protein [Gammaproteobacteria bacterium]HIL96891.1 hypothetical protein [Pseudomonadales bacterium]
MSANESEAAVFRELEHSLDLYLDAGIDPVAQARTIELCFYPKLPRRWLFTRHLHLQNVAGNYRSDELEVLYHLSINEDGELNLEFLKSDLMVLKPHSEDIFISENGTLRFNRDENLNINGFSITSGRIRNLALTKI